jgi:HemK-like putative methylase
VTDRIGLTLHRIQEVLDGDLGEIVNSLVAHSQAEKLRWRGRGRLDSGKETPAALTPSRPLDGGRSSPGRRHRDARLDSELLLRHVFGWERADLIARASEEAPGPAAALFEAAIDQRARRRPLQHRTGHQAFWKHDFLVSPDVLIPRPETELLVETALELVGDRPAPVVDVGRGSGFIDLSLAAGRTHASYDRSPGALLVARGNTSRLHLEPRVTFR